jgi:Spy/CpxP family protein refolding chaperone
VNTTWKVILATLVIFGAGVVVGGLLVKHAKWSPFHVSSLAQQPPPNAPTRPDGSPRASNHVFNPSGPLMPGLRRDFLKNLDHEVQLTAEQRERIEKILAEGQECTKQLWDKVAPDVHKEWVRTKDRIRAELTDEQKQRFEEFMKRSKKSEERRPQSPREDLAPKDAPQ